MSSEPSKPVVERRSDVAIRVRDVSKHYAMFQRPEDRFKQMVVPRLQRVLGLPPRRYFRDFAALNGISFEVGRGETIGIVGRNGSGKSTLLQIVCGTLQPSGGTVEVNGRIAALLELGAGFNPEFTGRENVFLNATILGVPRREMEWRFDKIASFANIGPFLDQPVKTYSSGMYMRLAFATAINVDPDILVVDEALAVGDEAFQRKCFARIEEIKDKGGTILFVSHGAQTIVQLCTRALLIDGGEMILQGGPKSVVGQYQRLINASPATAAEIRKGIVEMQALSLENDALDQAPHGALSTVAAPNIASGVEALPVALQPGPINLTPARPTAGSVVNYLDPSLRSQSAVELEARGARISKVEILTLDDEPVNVLRRSDRYKIRYEVAFTETCTQIGFAANLRTIDGRTLGGIHTRLSRASRLERAESGDTFIVEMGFCCRLLPGTYFLTCGLRGKLTDDELVLHRIIDALALRVAPESDLVATGYFDLDFECFVTPRATA